VLLVLDNVEQIEDSERLVRALIDSTTGLRALVTSRVPLRLEHGTLFEVRPLRVADEGEDARSSPAAQLFMERAAPFASSSGTQTTGDWDDAAAICRMVDGLPLAIELTAARLASASLPALLAELGSVLDISTTDAARPLRHRTLRQAIRWTYELLDETQQKVLRTLGAMPGGARPAMATAVMRRVGCTGNHDEGVAVLRTLADAAMVLLSDGPDGDRVRMLNTVSAFAVEELRARGEETAARLAVFDELLEMADPPEPVHPEHRRQLPELLTAELPNLRALVPWLIEHTDGERLTTEDVDRRFRLMTALSVQLGTNGGIFTETYAWMRQFLDRTGAGSDERRADLMLRAGDVARNLGRQQEAVALVEGAAALVLGDQPSGQQPCSEVACLVRLGLGVLASDIDDHDAARRHWDHPIDEHDVSYAHEWCLLNAAFLEGNVGNYDRSVELTERGIAMAARIGDELGMVGGRLNAATVLRQSGQPEAALAAFREVRNGLAGLRNLEWRASCIEDLGCVFADLGRYVEAAVLFRRAEIIRAPYSDVRHPSQETLIREPLDRTLRTLGGSVAEVTAFAEDLDLEQTLDWAFRDAAEPTP
jgi:predicted ATPase